MFEPISIKKYVDLYIKANPAEKKHEVEERLRDILNRALSGTRCRCDNPIWVVGGAEAGLSCITGESTPNEDFEIDEHLKYLQKGR